MTRTLHSNVAVPGQQVDKKKVKQLLTAVMEEKFLVSPSFRARCERFLRALTSDYSNVLKFQVGMVCTDGKTVWCDPQSESLTKLSDLTEKIIHLRGQITHEAAHILYTNFGIFKRQLLPPSNAASAEEKFRWSVRKNYLNIVEDEAIEMAVCNDFPGVAICINTLNEAAFQSLPSLDEAEKTKSRLELHQLACCMYGVVGKVKGTISDPELAEIFEKSKPILEDGRFAIDTDERLRYSDMLYELAKPLMEEAIQQGQHQQQQNGGQSSPNPKGDDMRQDGRGQGRKMPQNAKDFRNGQKQSGQKQKQNQKQQQGDQEEGQGQGDQEEQNDQQDSSSEGEDQNEQENGKDQQKESSSSKNRKKASEDVEPDTEPNSQSSSGQEDEGDEQESNASSKQEDESDQEDQNDSSENEETGEQESEEMKALREEIQKEIEEILQDMENEAELAEQSQKREERIKQELKNIKYSKYHDGFYVSLKPMKPHDTDDAKQKFVKHSEGIKPYARSLARRLQNVIRYNDDDHRKGLPFGYLDSPNLWREDGRIFTQKKNKSDQTDLCVMVLVDESGSMSHSAMCPRDQKRKTRTDFAREACIMLAEVCQSLNIPLAVWGHNVEGYSKEVKIRKYIDFFGGSIQSQKHNLSLMDNDSNTREGVSLKYVGEYMSHLPYRDKLLIVISDGDPEHSCGAQSLGGQPARTDAALVVNELERKHKLQIIGISIGDGHQSIPEIYKNYIVVPSLDHLPAKICGIVEKRLFKE